jgi:hypothetical protein
LINNKNIKYKIPIGRNSFQARNFKRSYRSRGKLARIKTNRKVKKDPNKIFMIKLSQTNRTAVKNLKKRIIPYSPKKKKAKFKAEYSVLNPDTNSLSPSAKSKGARFNSAIHLINQTTNKGNTTTINLSFFFRKEFKFNENAKQQGVNITIIKLIS